MSFSQAMQQGGPPQQGGGGGQQPGSPGSGPQAAQHFQGVLQQTFQQVQAVLQTLRGLPGIDQAAFQQGVQMMTQGWNMVAQAVKAGGGGGPPGGGMGGGPGGGGGAEQPGAGVE